jgi:hypothetical protein
MVKSEKTMEPKDLNRIFTILLCVVCAYLLFNSGRNSNANSPVVPVAKSGHQRASLVLSSKVTKKMKWNCTDEVNRLRKSRKRKYLRIAKESVDTKSDKGISLVKSIEKHRTKPYDDETGEEIKGWEEDATFGYGRLMKKKAGWVKDKAGINEFQTLTLFRNDLPPFDNVESLGKMPLSQNQSDASQTILKKPFGPISMLEVKFKSSEY